MRFEVFYEQIKELNINALQVEDKYNQLEEKVNNFVSGLNSLMLNAKDYQEVKNIEKTFNNIKENLSYSIQRWQSDFDQKQKHERFRDKLKNKFIVIIYGKVKAGKSTLGNFVANNNPSGVKPEKIEKIEKSGVKHDIAKFEEIDEGFAVAATECTTEIQLFEMYGLAWVDTPGLSSMNEENGKLAKSYIEAADFIVFPTSSDSPLQLDEIAQIKDLVKTLNKKVFMVITKSDIGTKDQVGDKLVTIFKNKDEATRKTQEEDVLKRLQENNINSNNLSDKILSISVKAAKEGIKNNDEELFKNSNIEKFYEFMQKNALAKANELKNQAPLDGINSLKQGIISDLQTTMSSFEELNNKQKGSMESIEKIYANLKDKICNAITLNLENSKQDIKAENINDILQAIQNKNFQDVYSIFNDSIKEVIEDFIFDLSKNTQIANYSITDRIIEIPYSSTRTIKDRDTFLAKLGEGVGYFIGRIAGEDTAHKISDALGNLFSSKKTIKKQDIKKEKVGDDKQDQLDKFLKDELAYYQEQFLQDALSIIKNDIFMPIEKSTEKIKNYILEFEKSLKELK